MDRDTIGVIVALFVVFLVGAVIGSEYGESRPGLKAVEHGCAVVKDGKIEWRGEGR